MGREAKRDRRLAFAARQVEAWDFLWFTMVLKTLLNLQKFDYEISQLYVF